MRLDQTESFLALKNVWRGRTKLNAGRYRAKLMASQELNEPLLKQERDVKLKRKLANF